MSTPYVGEIRMFAGNYAIAGWALCDGSLLSIANYETLYALLGTTYGGDGVSSFGLPDLRGRVPLHQGQSSSGTAYVLGQRAGSETVTVTGQQGPSHTHSFQATVASGTLPAAQGNVLGQGTVMSIYNALNPPNTPLAGATVTPNSGGQPHNNVQPFECVTFIIALNGIFPPQG